MIIEKIVIKSFGRITDMTVEFSEKVNVIEGENESGKSTIAAFIRYMLYGFENDSAEGELSERQKRINWQTGMASGSMYVRVGEKRYVITRSTVPTDDSDRPTYREESSIIDGETGAPAFGKLPAGEVFFGADAELFDNTAFIGRIGDSAINEESVKQSIENIIFSGSEKVNKQRAIARISDKMHALVHEGGGGGAIIDLIAKERSLDEKLEKSNMDNRMILEKESELHKIRARREEAEGKQTKLYDLDSSYNNAMLIQTFDRLHELEEECDEKIEGYKKFIEENTREGFVPDEKYMTDLVVARKGVNEAYHTLTDAQDYYSSQKAAIGITHEIENAILRSDELGGEEEIEKRAQSYRKKSFVSTVVMAVAALVALAAVVFEIVAIGTDMVFGKVAMGVLGILALGVGGYYVFDFLKSNQALLELEKEFGTETYDDLIGKLDVIADARNKRDALEIATENARLAVLKARDRYEDSKRILTTLILRWGEEPPSSELGSFLDNLEKRVREFIDKQSELLEEKNNIEITVREIRRNLANKSEIDVRAQVSPLKRKALSGINHDEIINGIAHAKARIAEEDRLAFEVENELMLLKGRAGDPGQYYSRIESVAQRREDLQEKHKAFFIALNAINNATDKLRTEISPRLGEYATRVMEIMTDKKYTSFDVSDGLKLTFTDDSGEQKSVDFLSGGTKDMAYIAVRAALIDMLYAEKPPICFDESFAHQDNVRAAAMMRAIAHLADEGCQSFIFTCRGREATLAKEAFKDAGIFKLS